ncbi:hypothetical protein FHR99_003285 [Litorivivens lipolytica]|uniref:Uncharacterized protein n=1 Tax=Litorivivens lipolytica TaxID=1524264 RepID=A0A7W4W7M2_9GAMM|nr:hypothetical protein [Litorivivens lipolytica]MBB3049001.1 hypothetical protein [Litorivivens lipolytica]
MIDEWNDLAQLHIEFAKILNKESGRPAINLWLTNCEKKVLPLLPKNSPGALWLGWQKPKRDLACAIRIGPIACDFANFINSQRNRLMSALLSSSSGEREKVISFKFKVPFAFMLKDITWLENPSGAKLMRSDVAKEFFVFRVGSEDEWEDIVASEEIFLYSGRNPRFSLAV